MPGIGTYWHTIRYLRPSQLAGRVWYRLARPRPDLRPAPAVRPAPRDWITPPPRRASLLGPTTFRFLNDTQSLEGHGWDDPALPKLWRYNQHYFDDLAAEGAEARRAWQVALVERWVSENPPGRGTGWEAYPTSLRIANWVKGAWRGAVLSPAAVQSLAAQARWLSRRIEVHLLGNHLVANAKALVFAGAFFAGPEAEGWLATGLDLLARELDEQVLADGGHFERSPMYHLLILEDLLDVLNVLAHAVPDAPGAGTRRVAWAARAGGMLAWARALRHPDGEIAFFNDAALGIAPSSAAIEAYAAALGVSAPPAGDGALVHLASSGYVRLAAGDAVALLDVALLGPDYLPAHGHADTLSFELSLGSERVIVNGGTGEYGTGAERQRQRGTAAHSTVEVAGADSSEVWGGFRVARRARPIGCRCTRADALEVTCAHDGYARLAGAPVHERRWRLAPGVLAVRDAVRGGAWPAVARYHLHPAVRPVLEDGGARLDLGSGRTVRVTADGGACRLEPSSWHPEFGLREATQCLAVDFTNGPVDVTLRWEDGR